MERQAEANKEYESAINMTKQPIRLLFYSKFKIYELNY